MKQTFFTLFAGLLLTVGILSFANAEICSSGERIGKSVVKTYTVDTCEKETMMVGRGIVPQLYAD